MEKKRMKIGYMPTRRNVFSAQEAQRYRKLILEKIVRFDAEMIDIIDINTEGLLFDENDAGKIVKKFKTEDIDRIFVPHCNSGAEDLVGKVVKEIEKPVLLWGPRDDSPLEDSMRTRDTQCGLFATGKILRRLNIPFTYIENFKLEDTAFEEGYKNFIPICAIAKAFKKIRILQIGPRPAGFWTMIYNEGELLERFGIEVIPITIQDIVFSVEQEAVLMDKPVFFADFTVRHPINNNAELLWHCGNFPPSLSKDDLKKEIGRHFIFSSKCIGTGEWELKGGDITLCRFDGDHGVYSLLFGEGKGIEGPKTRGTYVWFEVENWPMWERKIVEGPYIHHCVGVHAKVKNILKEACRYLPGVNADPL